MSLFSSFGKMLFGSPGDPGAASAASFAREQERLREEKKQAKTDAQNMLREGVGIKRASKFSFGQDDLSFDPVEDALKQGVFEETSPLIDTAAATAGRASLNFDATEADREKNAQRFGSLVGNTDIKELNTRLSIRSGAMNIENFKSKKAYETRNDPEPTGFGRIFAKAKGFL